MRLSIWANCVIIFGIGYLGHILGTLNRKEGEKGNSGTPLFILMTLAAIILFALSITQTVKFK